ncbi:MAG: tetratricopeptide repeat protein [Proteobacteria bacterium]|nr:tetratricopeptide repeat protein [Pseudomonadota bacterium]
MSCRVRMHQFHRRLAACLLLAALILAATVRVQAGADTGIEAAGYLIDGENALQDGDYLQAAVAYRKAAELSDNVEVAQKATKMALRLGFNEEALLAVNRWLELDEDNDEAAVYYAQLQLRLGNIRAARRAIEKLIDTGDGKADQRLLSLLPVLSDEDPHNADRLMRSLAKPYKNSAPANYATAVMALQAGDAEYAQEKAARAVELDPDWLKPKLVYGRALLLDGQLEKAIDYTARIIGDAPNPDPDARMELALMYMSDERDDDAMSQVNQILLEQSGRSDALRLLAIINFRQRNFDAAWDDFEDLLASGDYTMDALYYLARISDIRGQLQRAIELYSQVRSGQHAVTSQRRAGALMALRLEEPDEALRQLDLFAERNPEYAVDMVLAKAQLLTALGEFDDALLYYDKAQEFRPADEGTALGRAELLLRMDRLEESIDAYRRAVRRWPESPLSLNALGYTLADRTDRLREAEKLIRKALRYDPESPAIIDSLGWVLYKRGHNEKALEQLQEAYKNFPDHEVAAHVVDVLVALERDDDALEFLAEAEARNPDSELLRDVRHRRFPDTE